MQSMKRALVLSVAALAAFVFAQDKVKIEPKYKADTTTSYKITMKMNVGGADAQLTGDMVVAVKKVTDAEINVDYDWQNGKATVNGEEMQVPFGPTKVVFDAKGSLVSVTDGIEGTDAVRTFLVAYVHLPTEEVAKDGSWKSTLPANTKLDIKARTIEGTYLGGEEVGGKKTHKFKVKMTEEGGLSSVLTAWVDGDGQTVKLEGEFSELPIPVAGQNASGTVKLELAKS